MKTNVLCVPQLVLQRRWGGGSLGSPSCTPPAGLHGELYHGHMASFGGCCEVTSSAYEVAGWVFYPPGPHAGCWQPGELHVSARDNPPSWCRDAAEAPLMGQAVGSFFNQELGGGRVLRRRKRKGRRNDNYFFQWL